jgi:hypothetical protein
VDLVVAWLDEFSTPVAGVGADTPCVDGRVPDLDTEAVPPEAAATPLADGVGPDPAEGDEVPTLGAELDGTDTLGAETLGTETEGADTFGAEIEGAETEGVDTLGVVTGGVVTDGTVTTGVLTGGVDTCGTVTDGTLTLGTVTDGTLTLGSEVVLTLGTVTDGACTLGSVTAPLERVCTLSAVSRIAVRRKVMGIDRRGIRPETSAWAKTCETL